MRIVVEIFKLIKCVDALQTMPGMADGLEASLSSWVAPSIPFGLSIYESLDRLAACTRSHAPRRVLVPQEGLGVPLKLTTVDFSRARAGKMSLYTRYHQKYQNVVRTGTVTPRVNW